MTPAIYLTEAAEKLGDTKALNVIRLETAAHNGLSTHTSTG